MDPKIFFEVVESFVNVTCNMMGKGFYSVPRPLSFSVLHYPCLPNAPGSGTHFDSESPKLLSDACWVMSDVYQSNHPTLRYSHIRPGLRCPDPAGYTAFYCL